MIEVEYRKADRVFVFNRELTNIELQNTEQALRSLNGYIRDYDFIPIVIPRYTVTQASDMANDYQYIWFDQMGTTYLLNAKIQLMLTGASDSQSPLHLPYQMIRAVERFIQKIWATYDNYKLLINSNIDVVVDYSTVGEPPCRFKDIQWVLDENYRLKEPNRPVNLDINYYINWN